MNQVTPIISGSSSSGRCVNSQIGTWNGVTVHSQEMHWDGGEGWQDVTSEQTALWIVFEQIGGRYEFRVRRDQRPGQATQGEVSFAPAGVRLWGYASQLRYLRHARILFDLDVLSAVLGEKLSVSEMNTPRLMFSDERVWHLGGLLARECARPEQCDRLYGDSLAIALAVNLPRIACEADSGRGKGGLAPWQLRKLTDYMQGHLADNIELKELADLTGLSQSHVGRAFRQSTGLPPHRWHLNARLSRARELLLDGGLPLAEVALSTGFADQSHFTKSFQRQMGTSPGAWRRERRD